ncbi:hypothetical protein GBA52_009292 [Prunus armeniaca]|nr:hypothetical protein GBA52_009292 [Prunus armeniaca]
MKKSKMGYLRSQVRKESNKPIVKKMSLGLRVSGSEMIMNRKPENFFKETNGKLRKRSKNKITKLHGLESPLSSSQVSLSSPQGKAWERSPSSDLLKTCLFQTKSTWIWRWIYEPLRLIRGSLCLLRSATIVSRQPYKQ